MIIIKILIYKLIKILFLIFLFSIIIVEALILIAGNKVESRQVDYLIVLGARLYGETPSPSLLERLKMAKEYLDEYQSVKVVVSGGQGADEDVSEGYAMSRYLIENGIDRDRIIIEDKSTSTFENLKFSLEKIRKTDDKKNIEVLITSNKYHIFRSKLLAKRLGMVPYGLAAEIPPTTILSSYIREYFAVIKSLFYDKL